MNDLFQALMPAIRDDWPDDYQMQFWEQWPSHFRKHSRKQVFAKLARIKADRDVQWAALMGGLARYLGGDPEPQFIPAPLVWLNGQRWEVKHAGPAKKKSFMDVAMGRG